MLTIRPITTSAGAVAATGSASVLEDLLSFNDDIARPLDGYLLAFDGDITVLLHGDRGRPSLQSDVVVSTDGYLLAHLPSLVFPHVGRAVLGDRIRFITTNRNRLIPGY